MDLLTQLKRPFAGRGYALAARRALLALQTGARDLGDWVRYRRTREVARQVEGRIVRFTTRDRYSRWWFLRAFPDGYEVPVTRLLVELLRDAPLFVDVGSNIGYFACVAAGHLEEGEVWAFEMNERFSEIAAANAAANAFANVRVVCAAVADRRGELRMRPRLSSEGKIGDGGGGWRARPVEVVALDDVFSGRLPPGAVIKIDVEGSELRVLRGMRRILEAGKDLRLLVEVHPAELAAVGASAAAVVALLRGHGFEVSLLEETRRRRDVRLRELSSGAEIESNSMIYARGRRAGRVGSRETG